MALICQRWNKQGADRRFGCASSADRRLRPDGLRAVFFSIETRIIIYINYIM